MTTPIPEPSQSFQDAVRFMQAGKTVFAEQIVFEAAKQAEIVFGAESQEYASAQNDLGSILLRSGKALAAASAFRKATSVRISEDRAAIRDRMTYQLNLAASLIKANQFNEAYTVIQSCLLDRQRFYGMQHPGYAFALELLAEWQARKQDGVNALQTIYQAIQIFFDNRHPKIASALALREILRHTYQPIAITHPPLDRMPNEVLQQMITHLLDRMPDTQPAIMRTIFRDLSLLINQRFGEGHPLAINLLISQINLERKIPDLPFREREPQIRRLIQIHDRCRQPRHAIHAVLGLAGAYRENGLFMEAWQTYQEALTRAEAMRDGLLKSQTLLQIGRLLQERGDTAEALSHFQLALLAARETQNTEQIGRCLVACGVHYHDHKRLTEARAAFQEAMELLPAIHLESLTARTYLQALEENQLVSVDSINRSICSLFRQHVLQQIPEGLASDLEVKIEEDRFDANLKLIKQPELTEIDLIQRVVHDAVEQIQSQLANR